MFLDYQIYDITIDVVDATKYEDKLVDIRFHFSYYDMEYTKMHLGVRYFWFAISSIVVVIYLNMRRRMEKNHELTYDQNILPAILISLMMFNDPLYAINLFFPNVITPIISAFWIAAFYCILLYYFLRTFEKH